MATRSCNGNLLDAPNELMARRLAPIGENSVLRAALWDGRAGSRVAAALRHLALTC